jgi:hypothetical protein
MLKVKSNFDLTASIVEVFRSGAEDSLTAKGYLLISKQQQEEALKEQAKQQKSDCYDDACLVDTGKMMAAQMIFIIDINKTENNYLFKIRLLDLETGSVKRTVTKLYKEELSDLDKLLKFSKELTNEVLGVKKYTPVSLFELKINTNPQGALVYIDDNLVGKTPLRTKAELGKHKFKITLDRYNDILYNKEILTDDTKTLNLIPKSYTIKITSDQEKIKVYYKNKYMGETPLNLRVTINDVSRNITLKKFHFYTSFHKITEGDFDKNININLTEIEKYNLTIKVKPETAKIYLSTYNLDEISLKSGETKLLYKGLYSIKIKNKGYSVSDYFDRYINFESDKKIEVEMLKNTYRYLNFHALTDVTIGSELKYLSTGVGVELLNFINDNRKITLFGVNFNRNMADNYFYTDIYSNIKWEVASGFSLGLNISGILGAEVKTIAGGGLIEYEYMISKLISVKVFFKGGLCYFNETNAGDLDMLFMTSGVSINFIGFGE